MQKAANIFKRRTHITESPMERLIVNELLTYDIEFETQYKLGKYRLDVAFPKHKIGLEIDGQEWHRNEEQKAKDRLRDEILNNMGWIIERVPGWLVYRSAQITALKVLRHIPELREHPRIKEARGRTITWFIGELVNDGYKKEALGIIEKNS